MSGKYEEFEAITMQTKLGRKLYLDLYSGKPEWTFDSQKACVFNTSEQAETFARKWFKDFKNWKVETVKMYY